MIMTLTPSFIINEAVEKAEAAGNSLVEVSTDWTKVRAVAHMKYPLTTELRALLDSDTRLRGWTAPRTPHNASDEGFTDDMNKVSISFPVPRA